MKAIVLLCRASAYERACEGYEAAVADYTTLMEMAGVPNTLKVQAIMRRASRYFLEAEEELAAADYAAGLAIDDVPLDYQVAALFDYHIVCTRFDVKAGLTTEVVTPIDLPCLPVASKARAHLLKGMLHHTQGKRKSAIAAFDNVIEMPEAPADVKAMAIKKRHIALSENSGEHSDGRVLCTGES